MWDFGNGFGAVSREPSRPILFILDITPFCSSRRTEALVKSWNVGMIFFLVVQVAVSACLAEPVRVTNGTRPSQSIRNWHLKEEWRAPNEESDVIFGRLADVAADPQNNIYLLDYQQQETYVFSPEGKHFQTLGRKGEGPGETTMASRLLMAPDRIGLMNRYPAEIVWLDLTGDPLGSIVPVTQDNPEAALGCWWARSWTDRIIWAVTVSNFNEGNVTDLYHIANCNAAGDIESWYLTLDEDAYTHGSRDGTVDESQYFHPMVGHWDVDPGGNVWIATDRDLYFLQVLTPDGRTIMETTRDFTSPSRSPAEIRKIQRSLDGRWGQTDEPIVVGEYGPCVEKLWIMENPWGTEVWIESGASHHDLPPGVMVRYDLFDLAGNFTHQVDIVGEGDPLFDRWYIVGNNRLIMVRNASSGGYDEDDPDHPRFDDGELTVISYQIVWEE